MGRACCVPNCNSGKQAPRHKFPKDPMRCHQWIRSLKLAFLENACAQDLNKYRVCYKHFREEDYKCSLHYHVLTDSAIPGLYINAENNTENNPVNKIILNDQQPLQHAFEENEISQSIKDMSHRKEQVKHHTEILKEVTKQMQHHSQELTKIMEKVTEQRQHYSQELTKITGEVQHQRHQSQRLQNEVHTIKHKHENRIRKLEEQLRRNSKKNSIIFSEEDPTCKKKSESHCQKAI